MKKIVLSTIATLTLSSVCASANEVKLYQDANGQVFTKPADGRVEIKSSALKSSKASKLKFGVNAFMGYTFNDHKEGITSDATTAYNDDSSAFELRRAYFQVKAYLLDDPKSFYRITFDVSQNDEGDVVARTKYAYLYLNEILPSTGLEIGIVHRPWHDYETSNSWYFRNMSKGFIEASNGSHLSSSADFGFDLKTKTKYFDSEFGIYNGEGYHSEQKSSAGMSFEWRTTAHLLGVNGAKKQTKKTYLDMSFFGQINQQHNLVGSDYEDLIFGGLHTVYNQPEFLVSAQYIYSTDTVDGTTISKQAGAGYSANAEYRLGDKKEYSIIARYDNWTPKDKVANKTYIAGTAWTQNKNIQWVGNVIVTNNEDGSSIEKENGVAYMVTAQVKF